AVGAGAAVQRGRGSSAKGPPVPAHPTRTHPVSPVEDEGRGPLRVPPGPGHAPRPVAGVLWVGVGAGLPPRQGPPVPPGRPPAVGPRGDAPRPPEAVGVAAEGRPSPPGRARVLANRPVRRRPRSAGGGPRGR